jgi:hypothetical protein
MSISSGCFVFLGWIWDGPLPRLKKSSRMWCVIVCDPETSENEAVLTRVGLLCHRKKSLISNGSSAVFSKTLLGDSIWIYTRRHLPNISRFPKYFTKYKNKYIDRKKWVLFETNSSVTISCYLLQTNTGPVRCKKSPRTHLGLETSLSLSQFSATGSCFEPA